MVRLAGLEPATLGLEGRCSIQMSYRRAQNLVGVERFELPTSCSQSRRATRLRYTPHMHRTLSEKEKKYYGLTRDLTTYFKLSILSQFRTNFVVNLATHDTHTQAVRQILFV